MSQNALSGLRRKTPRVRGTFPDARYQATVLQPLADAVDALLGDAARDAYRAHAIVLGEQRIVDPPVVAAILVAVDSAPVESETLQQHLLSQIERAIVSASSAEVLQGSAPEEIAATAIRLVLKARALSFAEAIIELRSAVAELAAMHPLTMLLATANGQVIQPTTLGHYLHGQIGPLSRTCARLHGCFERLNQSPLGAVSGMSTAMPIRPKRAAELLGFDGVIENSFDALAAGDVFHELVSAIATSALETTRLVADMQFWARDDVGLLVPGDEYVHHTGAQPQRRDPLVLDHLRVAFGRLTIAPAELTAAAMHRPMLPGAWSQHESFLIVERTMAQAIEACRLLADVVRSSVVNRALFAHRANRGFSTSSELADLLAVDFGLPRTDAHTLAERVVVDWSEQGGEATTLTPEHIDRMALPMIGRELGVDPELLAKCLSPKRFVERRDVPGGPAPSAVGAALDRETFALNRERGWLADRQAELTQARSALLVRAAEIIEDPEVVTQRTDRAGQVDQ